jgi:hypothetical protein
MDDMLLGIVLERLEKSLLTEDATDLLLAAFESEESLSAQLSSEAAAHPSADAGRCGPAGSCGRVSAVADGVWVPGHR